VIRPHSHSYSDDERLYKTPRRAEAEAASDPVRSFETFLVSEGILLPEALKELRQAVADEIEGPSAGPTAGRSPSRKVPSPTSTVRRGRDGGDLPRSSAPRRDAARGEAQEELSLVEMINRVLFEEMERDPRIIVFGQDVADLSRSKFLDQLKGKGGVFKVTQGLQRKYGDARVFNTPLAEANIVGRAIGMAIRASGPWWRSSSSTTSGPP